MSSYTRNLKLVKKHLQKNESIITWIEGRYIKKELLRKGVLIATETRIIFFANKIIGFDLESFPYSRISSYEQSKELLGHKIKFFASGNEVKIKWVRSTNFSEFSNYINSKIGILNTPKDFSQTESIASQLDKLATLLERKLISEEEFHKMKYDITSSDKQIKNDLNSMSSINEMPNDNGSSFKKILKFSFIILFVVPIVISIISMIFFDFEVHKYDNHKIRYAKSNLNLRNIPTIGDNIIKVIKPNEKVITYDSIVGGYIMIIDSDSTKIGWASNKYLQINPLNKAQLGKLKRKEHQKETTQRSSEAIPKYSIINEEINKEMSKVSVNVRLEKEVSKANLKKIGLKIKKEKSQYSKVYIFYFLPQQELNYGAWAITHFTPKIQIEILGTSKKYIDEMNNKEIAGVILKTWDDSNPITPSRIYLVNKHDELYITTVFAKTKFGEAFEVNNKIKKDNKGGQTIYKYDNNHGEYFILEKNGNLGIYNSDGKIKEAIREF